MVLDEDYIRQDSDGRGWQEVTMLPPGAYVRK
jgi:hypothetical protein